MISKIIKDKAKGLMLLSLGRYQNENQFAVGVSPIEDYTAHMSALDPNRKRILVSYASKIFRDKRSAWGPTQNIGDFFDKKVYEF